MKNSDQITYYCFNKKCQQSILQHNCEQLHMPFTMATLAANYRCSKCRHHMISLIDIEIKVAMATTRAMSLS